MKWKALMLRHGLMAILLGMTLLITGCGGSSDSSSSGNTSQSTLSGTAATGAPMVGFVYVTDAAGTEINVAINSDGSFSADVTGMTAPFVLRAVPDDTSLPTQYSYAAAVDVTVNITQLTSLVLFLSNSSQDLDALVQNWVAKASQITSVALAAAQAQVNANYLAQFTAQSLDATIYDFFSTAFTADSTGFDALLDAVQVTIDMSAGTFSSTISGVAFTFDLAIDVSGIDIGGSSTGGGGGSSTVTVTAGAGLTPAYTWTGGNVMSVTVVRTSSAATVVWGIASPGTDSIASGAVHGSVPTGAVQTFSAETSLTDGVEYMIAVSRFDGSVGTTTFTASGSGGSGGTGTTLDSVAMVGGLTLLDGNSFDPTYMERATTVLGNAPDTITTVTYTWEQYPAANEIQTVIYFVKTGTGAFAATDETQFQFWSTYLTDNISQTSWMAISSPFVSSLDALISAGSLTVGSTEITLADAVISSTAFNSVGTDITLTGTLTLMDQDGNQTIVR